VWGFSGAWLVAAAVVVLAPREKPSERSPLVVGEQRFDRHDDVGRGQVVVMATS
jgi:hypothetical protein